MLKKVNLISLPLLVLFFTFFSCYASAVTPTVLVPSPPTIEASGYIIQDLHSGKIFTEHNADTRMAPASLTKLMTLYIAFDALKSGRLKLEDKAIISKKAWQIGGARMFVRHNEEVPVEQLIQGIIIVSGNDATVALAEHIAGSEDAFVSLMNQQAQSLGMNDTHFADSTGMPDENHYSTARDLLKLTDALIRQFPEYYRWFSLKWFTYNNIKQPNRNRLLWRSSNIDGLKTGHTLEAGFCLIASGYQGDMRLVSVVLGTKSDNARTNETQKLFTYGFRFFETHKLYEADKELTKRRAWMGRKKYIGLGITNDMFVTIPRDQYQNLKASIHIDDSLRAPIKKGQTLGSLKVMLGKTVITESPLIALEASEAGNLFTRLTDYLHLMFNRLFNIKSPS